MKKALALILCIIMVAAMAVSTISADVAKLIDARELQAYGQHHFYLGDPATGSEIPDVTDGNVNDGEYEGSIEFKKGDYLTYWSNSDNDGKNFDNEWFKIYVDYDAETLYFGYQTKDVNFVSGKDLVTHMFSFWDVGTTAGAIGRLAYICTANEDGSVSVSVSNFRKDEAGGWNKDEKINPADYIIGSSCSYDEDSQVLTIEVSIDLVKSKEWWGNDLELEDARMYYAPYCRGYGESTVGAGDVVSQGIVWSYLPGDVSNELKMNFVLDYPDISYWGNPMFFPHIVHFCEEPEPTTPPPTEATTTVVTTPKATTAKVTTAKATTAAATTAAATDAPVATTAAPATTAAAEKGCGGTIALSALALVPMLGAAVVFGKKKED